MKKYYADRKSLNLLRVVTFFLLAAIIIGLKVLLDNLRVMYPEYFAVTENTLTEWLVWSVMALLAVAYVLFLLIYLPLWYNSAEYCVSEKELSVKAGVLYRTVKYIKLSAVQYVTVISAPLSKITSFNFLVMSVQGGRIPFLFLSKSDAEEIAEFIAKNKDE